ncbi:MAG: flagellar basal body L-ring protein FlgH [Planctomycetes bacterium]|nr:flagellar basal body L-ring protein FlgH [Planctomycetota bacterium]
MRVVMIILLPVFCSALSAQALFQAASRGGDRGSYYEMEPEKPRAWRVHDLVTIKIGEKVSARRSDSIETRKSMEVEAQLDDWVSIDGGTGNLVSAAPLAPGIDVSADYQVQNDGARNRTSTFSDVITAEVVQILPNGRLQVRAFKEIKVMDDTERVELTCGIDPEMIDARTRSIDANRCFGLRIRYTGEGDVSDSASTGWLTDVLNFLWPF